MVFPCSHANRKRGPFFTRNNIQAQHALYFPPGQYVRRTERAPPRNTWPFKNPRLCLGRCKNSLTTRSFPTKARESCAFRIDVVRTIHDIRSWLCTITGPNANGHSIQITLYALHHHFLVIRRMRTRTHFVHIIHGLRFEHRSRIVRLGIAPDCVSTNFVTRISYFVAVRASRHLSIMCPMRLTQYLSPSVLVLRLFQTLSTCHSSRSLSIHESKTTYRQEKEERKYPRATAML